VKRALAIALTACACRAAPPAYGEVVVIIDTDATVPAMVSRLRVDLYDAHGTWFASREYPAREVRDWPLSFSVYTERASGQEHVRVRARAFPEGRTRRYVGEQFAERGFVSNRPPDDQPRLIVDGNDVTPSFEPLPSVTLDRSFELAWDGSERASARVVLHAACVGAMVDLAGARTCKESLPLVPIETIALAGFDDRDPKSVAGTVLAPDQCGDQETADRVCIPGGAFLLGERSVPNGATEALLSAPEVPARVRWFLLDRTEVTWRRWHTLGVSGPKTEGCVVADPSDLQPVTCVTWSEAREACRKSGGDLPTEAEWEWAASVRRDRRSKHPFPWGDVTPNDCKAANVSVCPSSGTAQPADGAAWAATDRTDRGVVGMLGNVAEWTLDAAARYDAGIWRGAPFDDPKIDDPSAVRHVMRGLHFASSSWSEGLFTRSSVETESANAYGGFRCAYH
jgi:formylglycine-generating enzyme required for sulfatase activity